MSRWFSPTTALMAVLLGFAGFAAYRSGWIPLEFGGTSTGSLVETDRLTSGLEPTPELEADDSPPFDIGGAPREVLTNQTETPLIDETDSTSAELPVRTAIHQRTSGRTSSQLRLVAEEQPAAAPKKSEPATSPTTDLPAAESETNSDSPADPPVRVAKRPKDQEPTFDFAEIDRQIKMGQVVEAHKALSKLYWQQPDLRSHVQERIDLTAKAIYFSPQPHVQEPYVVQAGDQLRKIATKHHVPWQYLARLNRTDPKRLREGQKLKIIDGPFGAVVTLSDFELTLHHGGQYVRSYPCCIGKNNSSPVGKFKVLNKVTNPQYTDPDGKVFASGDPKNPLGTHWIDLGDSYGIHGTIEPDSIGKAESRGCIRLINADVTEVYDLLDVAAEVVIRP